MTEKTYKTLEIIKFNEDKPDKVVLPQEVCNIEFRTGASLSLLASKLFVQLVKIVGSDIVETKRHRVSYSALNWANRDKELIRNAVLELISTTVHIQKDDHELIGTILNDVKRDYDDYSGGIEFKFSDVFIEVVKNSSLWATISAQAVLLMECKYSIWLYQMIAPRKNLKYIQPFEINLDELRTRLGATAKTYMTWIRFRNFVLDPAIEEINFLTDIIVRYETIKRSRWVVAVKFYVAAKSPEEIWDVKKEHQKSRLGRKERKQIYSQERKQMFASLMKRFD